jgi:hypothetical protein
VDELTDLLRRTLRDPRHTLRPAVDPVPEVHRGIRRRRARRTAAAGSSLAVVALAAGSALALAPGSGPQPPVERRADGGRELLTPTPTPSPSAAPAPSPSPSTTGPAFPADTGPDVGGPEHPGNRLTVVDVRVARQDGYDRVVYELAGDGEPGWRVEYVDEARAQGSGDEVPLPGDSRLEVTVLGVGYPGDTGIAPYDGPERRSGQDTAHVTHVWAGFVYEGRHQSFVGLAGPPRPFRVFALSDPTRLVVDVRDR